MNLLNQIKQIDQETDGEIRESIESGRFKLVLNKNLEWIGFLTWSEHFKDGKKHIFIRNLYIGEEYRNVSNLLFLRRFFRNIYKHNFRFVFWHNGKRDRFYYTH